MRSLPETEWDDQQRGWVLALHLYRQSLCPCGCGHKLTDTTSRESEGPKFHVPAPTRCRARDALALRQEASTASRPEALLWRVEKR